MLTKENVKATTSIHIAARSASGIKESRTGLSQLTVVSAFAAVNQLESFLHSTTLTAAGVESALLRVQAVISPTLMPNAVTTHQTTKFFVSTVTGQNMY